MKTTTLCFLVKDNKILLAMKKRGFGEGRFNGVGGKVLPKEDIEAAVIREAEEEINVTPQLLDKVAELTFLFPDKPDWNQICYVYLCQKWQGEPQESEEMKPKWYNLTAIPYPEMWSDDPYWLPRVLKGEKLKAKFTFDNNQQLVSHRVSLLKEKE